MKKNEGYFRTEKEEILWFREYETFKELKKRYKNLKGFTILSIHIILLDTKVLRNTLGR